jgi:hypothetical protein
LTDGGENASREFSQPAITALMDKKREEGWEFNFIGAGTAAWGGAQMLGIPHSHSINYSGSGAHTHDVFAAAAASNVAKTRGLSSSYAESATVLKAQLESDAGFQEQPPLQINIVPQALGRPVRKRGSGKNLK